MRKNIRTKYIIKKDVSKLERGDQYFWDCGCSYLLLDKLRPTVKSWDYDLKYIACRKSRCDYHYNLGIKFPKSTIDDHLPFLTSTYAFSYYFLYENEVKITILPNQSIPKWSEYQFKRSDFNKDGDFIES